MENLDTPWVAKFEDDAEEFWCPNGWWKIGPAIIPFGPAITPFGRLDVEKHQNMKAAARLISAAPDMLEALKAAIAISDAAEPRLPDGKVLRTRECQAVYDQCAAAIAKATGGQP